jgi:gag-polyprotein putative aspartyl protease
MYSESKYVNLKVFFLILFVACCHISSAQKIDSIPFSLDKQLLVFKGQLNGIAVDFAFDTGASSSVVNSKNVLAAGIKELKGSRSITDANQVNATLKNVLIEDLAIGQFHINKLKTITFDMPYLYCTNLLLLGQDVIKKFNWKIDFEKKVIYVSDRPFATSSDMLVWPIKYLNNRPMVELILNNQVEKNCLIDFGFNGILDVNPSLGSINKTFDEEQFKNQGKLSITSTMGLTGLGKPKPVKEFIMDSLFLNKTLIKNIPISINEQSDHKIGVQFFNTYCKSVILNHSTNTYHLSPSKQQFTTKSTFDARVTYKKEKLFITAKNMNKNSTALAFEMDEEIKSVNGKDAMFFKDECEFLLWFYLNKDTEVEIEKMNGVKIKVKKSNFS